MLLNLIALNQVLTLHAYFVTVQFYNGQALRERAPVTAKQVKLSRTGSFDEGEG